METTQSPDFSHVLFSTSDSSCHRNSILLSCVVSNSFTKQFLFIKKAHTAFIIAKCGSFPFIDIKPFNFHNNLGGRLQTKKQKHRFSNLPRVIWLLFDPTETAFSVLFHTASYLPQLHAVLSDAFYSSLYFIILKW